VDGPLLLLATTWPLTNSFIGFTWEDDSRLLLVASLVCIVNFVVLPFAVPQLLATSKALNVVPGIPLAPLT
jgi:hypothetical protein